LYIVLPVHMLGCLTASETGGKPVRITRAWCFEREPTA